MPLGFGLLLQLHDVGAQHVEAGFDGVAEQRVLVLRERGCDFGPVWVVRALAAGRKEIAVFHHDVTPLSARGNRADDRVDVVRGIALPLSHYDGKGDPVQTIGASFDAPGCEIAHLRDGGRIAKL